jgi:hypothetical protein
MVGEAGRRKEGGISVSDIITYGLYDVRVSHLVGSDDEN